MTVDTVARSQSPVAERSTGQVKKHLDSSIPLIALSRDANELLIHQFADKHGAYALVRGYDDSLGAFRKLATGRTQNDALDDADLWVHRIRPAAALARIGRSSSCDVRITDRSVAALHATLDSSQPVPTVCDHESEQGTMVGERPIVPGAAVPVANGQTVQVGAVEMVMVAAPDLIRVLRRVFPST
ncbi:MAG: FHA domain-containing protein [Deltaproteobacteria bacterium]|nr:FHA domain-containing protein [Deltaproteobacteria bacterium]